MSLETRLKAAFERVAATIKQRGLPAGGAAGQVLTKTGEADYAAGWTTQAAGGGLDVEAVQDIVGAMVCSGTNATVAYDDAAGTLTISSAGGGLSAVVHDGTLAGAGTPESPLRVLPQASSSSEIIALSSGYSVVESLPSNLALNAGMHANVYGDYMDLRYVAMQDITFRQIRLNWKTLAYPGNTLIEVHKTGNGYAVSNATKIASAQAAALPVGAWTITTLHLDADVTLAADERMVMRIYATSSGGLVEIRGTSQAVMPLLLTGGDLAFNAGVGQTDSSGAAGRAPAVAFLAGLNKRVVGPLDPLDFPVVAAVAEIPNGGGARLRGTNNFYLRRDTGQLLEFVGTPVSG